MRIAFDFDAIVMNRFSGLHAYGVGLLSGLGKLANRPEAVAIYSELFKQEALQLRATRFGWVLPRKAPTKIRRLEKLWKHIEYPPLQWLIGNFDIYHCLYTLMPPTADKPCIMTVHDMRRYKLPELYENFKFRRFERAYARADHFIAVSQSTKNDLCEIVGVPQDKVDVIHLAADERLSPLPENDKNRLKAKFSEQMKTPLDRFVIAVSSSDSRKNIERMIRAFKATIGQLPKGMKLVVTGEPPKDFCRLEREKAYLDENVIWTNCVDNLSDWLGCSDALLYASLYEGFGIPILEAFASGVPVITSNCSSMPEVAGDAAVLVNPYDEQSISQAIVSICNDDTLRRRLISSGLERNQQFNWTKTAEQTLEVYRKML
jgi:glycosyltransferase involved in cell wall biosynthesis